MEVFNNKYVSTAITIALGLYAALLGPNLPNFMKDLFKNTLFRILILFLVVVRGNKDPKMAIMIAVAFILTLDYIYVRDSKEAFENVVEGMGRCSNYVQKVGKDNVCIYGGKMIPPKYLYCPPGRGGVPTCKMNKNYKVNSCCP